MKKLITLTIALLIGAVALTSLAGPMAGSFIPTVHATSVHVKGTTEMLVVAEPEEVAGLLRSLDKLVYALQNDISTLYAVDTTRMDSADLYDYALFLKNLEADLALQRDQVAALGYADLAADFETARTLVANLIATHCAADPVFDAVYQSL